MGRFSDKKLYDYCEGVYKSASSRQFNGMKKYAQDQLAQPSKDINSGVMPPPNTPPPPPAGNAPALNTPPPPPPPEGGMPPPPSGMEQGPSGQDQNMGGQEMAAPLSTVITCKLPCKYANQGQETCSLAAVELGMVADGGIGQCSKFEHI